jgi:signal recognition particle subunit SRP72
MSANPSSTLSSLLRSTTLEDHEELLRVANNELNANKGSLESQRTRVVALLKLDRFDDVLRAIAAGGDLVEKNCRLEKGYALYKTGRLGEASTFLSKSGNSGERSARHLAAQVAYRAENFEDALHIYQDLLSQAGSDSDEDDDLRINILAASAQINWKDDESYISKSDHDYGVDTFELAYNAACACLARGEFAGARSLLNRASRLCEDADYLSSDEKQVELLPILTQLAYVHHCLGEADEGAKLYSSLLAGK